MYSFDSESQSTNNIAGSKPSKGFLGIGWFLDSSESTVAAKLCLTLQNPIREVKYWGEVRNGLPNGRGIMIDKD